MIEIQNKLVRLGNQTLVEPQRKFVKEGMLAKLSMTDDSLQTRAVYLFSDLLLTAVPLVGGLMKVGTSLRHFSHRNFTINIVAPKQTMSSSRVHMDIGYY